jgi:hypothetical protein
MSVTLNRRAQMGAAFAAVLILLFGCADTSSTVGATPTTTTGSTEPSSSHVVRLSEATEGRTTEVARGDRIVLTLHNTYWTITPPDGRVLTQIGSQEDSPAPAGTCLAGVGCGTVRAEFVASSSGTATVKASRTTCGEAMACPPGEGAYTTYVVIG